MAAGITILNPGLLTTIQDAGRIGYQAYGVSVSGVMDPRAMNVANILVGNDDNEAVLECTMMGPQIRFDVGNVIAITGGDLGASVDGKPVPTYRALKVEAGQTLRFTGLRGGCRAFIAFAGGLDIPLVMGSRSTYMKAKIGGLEGRKLQKDDVIGFRGRIGLQPAGSFEFFIVGRVAGPDDIGFDLAGLCFGRHFGDDFTAGSIVVFHIDIGILGFESLFNGHQLVFLHGRIKHNFAIGISGSGAEQQAERQNKNKSLFHESISFRYGLSNRIKFA